MRLVLICLFGAALGVVCLLVLWRFLDHRADRQEQARLLTYQARSPAVFDPSMIRTLPEPARRFFLFSIREGTPLYPVARIEMTGRFGMGSKESHSYMPMQATELLAAPHGFLWKMSTQNSGLQFSGSDSGAWTRFWLLGLLPVVRDGGTQDHRLSAFGRYVAEAVIWSPAAVLPAPHVSWDPVSEDVARVTIRQDGLAQSVDLTVDQYGRPSEISLMRWSNANADGEYRWQRFGGTLSEFADFGGYRLATHLEAGNYFNEADYFAFFIADVLAINFPGQ